MKQNINNLIKDPNKREEFLEILDVLNLKDVELESTTYEEAVQEICCLKLCNVVGLNQNFNFDNNFFLFFSQVMGQAISNVLKLNLNIAPAELKYVRYDGLNIVNAVRAGFDRLGNVDEVFFDAFNLMEEKRAVINKYAHWDLN